MPTSDLHKRKKLKNIAVFAAVIVFMVVVFFVTMIRVKAGMNHG